jgi:ABC-2 type transport system permease protein
VTANATSRSVVRVNGGPSQALRDGLIVMWRNLKRIPRIPELAIFAIIQSIMFVLLFAFVFGGAIVLPGYADPNAFREYLMPGIFAQTIVFASATTAIGMADDVHKGILDRFRSLPMARSAVLTGRTLSDVVYNGGILIVLMLSGLAVGWTVRTGIVELLAGVGLLLLFAFAMSWLGVWLGLSVPTVEVAQQVGFTVLFPITFISNVFVATSTLPDWLQPVAEWNPTSTLTASLRELWGNPSPATGSSSFAAQEPVIVTLAWVVLVVVVFGMLGVRKYRSLSR